MKIILTSTIPLSLNHFCKGWFRELERSGYEVLAVSSPGRDLDEIEEREGARTIAVPMHRQIAPLKDLKGLWSLVKIFRKERPRMVHSFTPKAGLLSMMAAWITRVPVRVHTFTGLVFPSSSGLKRRLLMTTDRLTCLFATHVIPEGEGVKTDLQRYRITHKPLDVLGHGNVRGIDLKYFDPMDPEVKDKAAALRSEDRFTFLFVGRLVGDKGVNELVASFKKLNGEQSAAKLVLVGWEADADPLDPETDDEIRRNASIEYVGYQEDVRPWLLASDVLVLPSYREGFPNVVLEAGAMGLPSLVTDVNGSNEIIVDGKNGRIIPPRDPEQLYESMKEMMLGEERLGEMRRHARKMVAERYEQLYVRRCQMEYYREVLKGV